MSLPEHRRIQHGRTHAAAWDAVTYSCALERNDQTARRVLDWALDVGLATAIGVALACAIYWSI